MECSSKLRAEPNHHLVVAQLQHCGSFTWQPFKNYSSLKSALFYLFHFAVGTVFGFTGLLLAHQSWHAVCTLKLMINTDDFSFTRYQFMYELAVGELASFSFEICS